MADKLYQAWFQAKQMLEDYTAGGIGALITAGGSSNLIADGSETDGRNRISGDNVFNLVTAVEEFIDYVEGGAVTTADRQVVITLPHVNG